MTELNKQVWASQGCSLGCEVLSLGTRVILSGLGFCWEWWGKESWALEPFLCSLKSTGGEPQNTCSQRGMQTWVPKNSSESGNSFQGTQRWVDCYGLSCVLTKSVLTPVPQNMTIFKGGIFKRVLKLKLGWVHHSLKSTGKEPQSAFGQRGKWTWVPKNSSESGNSG